MEGHAEAMLEFSLGCQNFHCKNSLWDSHIGTILGLFYFYQIYTKVNLQSIVT